MHSALGPTTIGGSEKKHPGRPESAALRGVFCAQRTLWSAPCHEGGADGGAPGRHEVLRALSRPPGRARGDRGAGRLFGLLSLMEQ